MDHQPVHFLAHSYEVASPPVIDQIGRAACRESDWSSDVCSSDLSGIPGNHRWRRGNPGKWIINRCISWHTHTRSPRRQSLTRSDERRVGKVTGVQTCALPISQGFLATIVGGEVILENGSSTGAFPGTLIRGRLAASH